VLAKVMTMVRDDKMELAEAFNKVTEDAMKAQQEAEAAAPPTPEQAMAPAAMQAMAGPAAAMPAVQGPSPSQANLGQLLNTLRKGARV